MFHNNFEEIHFSDVPPENHMNISSFDCLEHIGREKSPGCEKSHPGFSNSFNDLNAIFNASLEPDGIGDSILLFILISGITRIHEQGEIVRAKVEVQQSTNENELSSPSAKSKPNFVTSSLDIYSRKGELLKEISVRIPLDGLETSGARCEDGIFFHIFLSLDYITPKENFSSFESSGKLDVICFTHYFPTSQVLHPVQRSILQPCIFNAPFGTFLASYKFSQGKIFHHIPGKEEIIRQAKFHLENVLDRSSRNDLLVLVRDEDIVSELHGARGGRPVHKKTGKLLMTKEQVLKIIEIRKRWEGLSTRQRRENVNDSDFYPFLTLNRDETALSLGVCATWLKDAIRAQGMRTWPGRPLRRSGALLQTQKDSLVSAQARLELTELDHPERPQFEYDVQRIKEEIHGGIQKRAKIVENNVSPDYFERFVTQNGVKYLDPTWNALPP